MDYSKSDDWAVGLIAYQMLCGVERPPYNDEGEGPEAYDDEGWRPIPEARTASYASAGLCRAIVKGLLRVDPVERLGVGKAKAMLVAARR